MDADLETPEIPTAADAESAMRDLIAPPEETPIETPEGDTPPAETPPIEGEKPADETPPPADGTEVPPGDVPEDNYDSEIDAIQLKPGASAKSQEALAVLKQKAKDEHKAAVEAARRAKELETEKSAVDTRISELESKVITPEVEQELTQLRQFRDTFGLEDDPSLNKPFEDRINQASGSLNKTLEQIGVPAATIKYITDNGGLYNFRMSNQAMPPGVKNADGTRMSHAQFYKRFIEGNLNEAQREELTDSYAEIRRAQRERQTAIDSIKNNRAEYLKRREESLKAAQDDWVNRVAKHSEQVLKTYGEVAQLKDIPPNATPEQKAAIEKHNEDYHKAEARARQILADVSPENLTEAAIAAGYAEVLKGTNATLTEQVTNLTKARDDLQKQLDDLKASGRTSDLRGATEIARAAAATKAKNAEDAMATLVSQGQ